MNKNDVIAMYAESASKYRSKWKKAESEKKELLEALNCAYLNCRQSTMTPEAKELFEGIIKKHSK